MTPTQTVAEALSVQAHTEHTASDASLARWMQTTFPGTTDIRRRPLFASSYFYQAEQLVGRYAGGWISAWYGVDSGPRYATLVQYCAAGDHWYTLLRHGSRSASGLASKLSEYERGYGRYVPDVERCADCTPPAPAAWRSFLSSGPQRWWRRTWQRAQAQ